MTKIENSFPGKDISSDDIQTKFPLAAKKSVDHKSIVKVGNIAFGDIHVPVMGGPNTVESLDLILKCAHHAKKCHIDILRGGAYKPLTFPYRSDKYFETRSEGIEWLGRAKRETGLLTVSEIVHEDQLYEMESNVDILQIGTRNMQNFPLLLHCARSGKPILLKRGFGSSIRDLLGAAEHILLEGNSQVILCERGVVAPHTHRASSRFLLDLQAVPALHEITHLPVVVDPSHACFWAPWVPALAKASIASNADGLMLEFHPDPCNAAVDPLQPLSFEEIEDLMPILSDVARAANQRLLGGAKLKT